MNSAHTKGRILTFREFLRSALQTSWRLAIACEALVGALVLALGLLGVRSYFVHGGRDLYFFILVLGVCFIGSLVLTAAWLLSRQRYWGQLFLLLLPLAPLFAIATD